MIVLCSRRPAKTFLCMILHLASLRRPLLDSCDLISPQLRYSTRSSMLNSSIQLSQHASCLTNGSFWSFQARIDRAFFGMGSPTLLAAPPTTIHWFNSLELGSSMLFNLQLQLKQTRNGAVVAIVWRHPISSFGRGSEGLRASFTDDQAISKLLRHDRVDSEGKWRG